jgi:uncharacterized protein (TIGR02996 family)
MEQHVRFLLALSVDPRDDLDRLVYADWLEDQGHPLGELLRLQVRIRSLPENNPEILACADRERALLAAQALAFEELRLRLAPDAEAAAILEERVLGLSRRHPVRFVCPACHGDRAFRWDAKNPLVLHWIINPGLAVNELLLGQRVPAVMLLCRSCLAGAVRCPVCRRHIPTQKFSEHAFGNWSGYRCPDCDCPLPMLRNLLAGLVVGLGKLAWRLWARKKR